MTKVTREPALTEGTTVWRRTPEKDGITFFSKVIIDEVFQKSERWYYRYRKLTHVSVTAKATELRTIARKDTIAVECPVFLIDNGIRSFEEIQAFIKETNGKQVDETSIYELPVFRPDRTQQPRRFRNAEQAQPNIKKTHTLAPPTRDEKIERWVAFFKKSSGNIRSRLIATAKHFDRDVYEVACEIKSRVAIVISDKLLDQLGAM